MTKLKKSEIKYMPISAKVRYNPNSENVAKNRAKNIQDSKETNDIHSIKKE